MVEKNETNPERLPMTMRGHWRRLLGAGMVLCAASAGLSAQGGSAVGSELASVGPAVRLTVVSIRFAVYVKGPGKPFVMEGAPEHACVIGGNSGGVGQFASAKTPLHLTLGAAIQTGGTCVGNVHEPVRWTVRIGTGEPTRNPAVHISAVTTGGRWSLKYYSASKRLLVSTLRNLGHSRRVDKRATIGFSLKITDQR